MKSELLVKVQYDSKNKLMKKEFSTLSELKSAVTACYPKRLGNKEIELKYEDSDGDWFSITEDSDVQAFKEYATSLGNKKAIVLVETTGDKKEESKEEIVASETEKLIEGVREALDEIKLDEEQKDDKKELKDFRFADAFGEVEALLNSDEKVRPGHIIKAVINAVKGTKAEIHFKRLIKRIKGGKRSPSHGRMWGRKHCGKKSRSPKKGDCEKNRASSSSPEEGFGGFHPMTPHEMVGFEHCGTMGYPFPNMMPPCYPGFGGYGEFGPRNHGCGKGKAMKFFRKFMKAFKDGSSSSDSSSTERKEKRKEKKEVNMEKRKEYRLKRPQVLEKPSEIKVKVLSAEVGNNENKDITTSMVIKIQNTSPWPFWLTGVRKIDGDEAIKFSDFKYSEKLFREKVLELNIPVTISSKAGEYTAKFGFLNKNEKLSGEEFSIKFIVSQ